MNGKTEIMRARCTPAEYQALVALAQHEQRGLSEMLREVVRQVAKQRGLWPLAVQPAGLPARTRDIRKPQAPTRARITKEEIK